MRWLAALFFVFMTGCQACKGDPEKCDRACRNYAQQVFWEGANAEIDKLPADQRDAARKQKMAEFAANLEKGVDLCVSKCVSANNTKDTDCLIGAKSAAAAKACVKD
ncbi:MAG TPA: hypothetical protein VFV99_18085 [Kofleriaceae bacterium]|nr:hypothetical protein [Kofleriaceae bacterium]